MPIVLSPHPALMTPKKVSTEQKNGTDCLQEKKQGKRSTEQKTERTARRKKKTGKKFHGTKINGTVPALGTLPKPESALDYERCPHSPEQKTTRPNQAKKIRQTTYIKYILKFNI